MAAAVGGAKKAGADFDDGTAAVDVDATAREDPLESPADRRVVRRQQVALAREQVVLEPHVAAAIACEPGPHRVLNCQDQLDSTGAATDDSDPPGGVACTQSLGQRSPAIEKPIDRLHRNRVLGLRPSRRRFGVDPMSIDSTS